MSGSAAGALILLQITDVHLRAPPGETLLGVDTWASVAAVLDQALSEQRPDALLVTGDVAHDPYPEIYARFDEWLRERYDGPRLVLAGNHDVAGNMGALAAPTSLDLGGWTVLGLDSHVDDEPQAEVDEAEIAALKAGCAAAYPAHVLVATHHPPLPVGSPWLDRDRIKNGPELLEWMSEHSTVRAMVFGHAHQELAVTHGRIALFCTPSTCVQFAPRTETFTVDESKPGYRWLTLQPDGSLQSVVRRVEDYPLTIDTRFKPA